MHRSDILALPCCHAHDPALLLCIVFEMVPCGVRMRTLASCGVTIASWSAMVLPCVCWPAFVSAECLGFMWCNNCILVCYGAAMCLLACLGVTRMSWLHLGCDQCIMVRYGVAMCVLACVGFIQHHLPSFGTMHLAWSPVVYACAYWPAMVSQA